MMILSISTDNVALLLHCQAAFSRSHRTMLSTQQAMLYMSTYIANRVYVLQCLHRELYYTIIKHSYIKE